ncbi:MAG: AAA family ATPase [Pseudomonadota bacterium]
MDAAETATSTDTRPRWLEDVATLLGLHGHFLITGHTSGRFAMGGDPAVFADLPGSLWPLLKDRGFHALLIFDGAAGLRLHPECADPAPDLKTDLGLGKEVNTLTPDEVLGLIDTVARADTPVALIMDYASQYLAGLDTDPFFVAIDRTARSVDRANPVFWVLGHPGDVPAWFAVGNAAVRAVHVDLPDPEERLHFAQHLSQSHFPGAVTQDAVQNFALQSDGMSFAEMDQVARLAVSQGIALEAIDDAIRTWRTGTPRNPWRSSVMRARVSRGREILSRRVKGQDPALKKTLDILTRSVMGLSGAQTSSRTTRPRGVLFFAGPTGVGKTELAKSVTELLFGDETAYQRFDMSEYLGEQSETKLIGAPPGAPGHQAGGELVNAVRRRPFSVFLFDEIEKAHPRVLDTFLQIIDEGRLTDGRGETAYFSEALLIFTSNIGMFGGDKTTNMGLNVLPSDSYKDLEAKITKAVGDHFRYELQRPELMNRLGQNIVVFDFINPTSAVLIFETILRRVLETTWEELGLEVSLTDQAVDQLSTLCTSDLFDGGRGIGNRIETHFINPLSRALFDVEAAEEVIVTGVTEDGLTHEVKGG